MKRLKQLIKNLIYLTKVDLKSRHIVAGKDIANVIWKDYQPKKELIKKL